MTERPPREGDSTPRLRREGDSTARLRRAVPDDSETIAALHVACWAETYRGLLPDALIDSMKMPGRIIQWQRALERRADVQVIVAEDADGGLLGFASGGPARGGELGAAQEVYAIYVLRRAQRQGLGRALLQSLAGHLTLTALPPAALDLGLWVLRDNAPARAFYERLGGEPGGERMETREGHALAEAAYRWRDLAALLGPSTFAGPAAGSPLDGTGRGFA
jgi:GNAT superfamily N-acetyltransferase